MAGRVAVISRVLRKVLQFIRRCRFESKCRNDRIQRLNLGMLLAKAADGDCALFNFTRADRQDHRDLAHRMFAYFVVDLLVARIRLGAHAVGFRRRANFVQGNAGGGEGGNGGGAEKSGGASLRPGIALAPSKWKRNSDGTR